MKKIFGKKNKSNENIADAVQGQNAAGEPPHPAHNPSGSEANGGSKVTRAPADPPQPAPQPPRPKLVFHCQQAHGSPTGIISGFTNVKELYQKIADCYDLSVSEVSACSNISQWNINAYSPLRPGASP